MNKIPKGYPRKVRRISVEHLRRKPAPIVALAQRDRVIILRAGKPVWTAVNSAYTQMIEERAGLSRWL